MYVKVRPSATLPLVFTLLPRYIWMLRSDHQLPCGYYLLCCPGIYVCKGRAINYLADSIYSDAQVYMDVKVGPSTTLRIVFTLLPGIYVILGTFPNAFPNCVNIPIVFSQVTTSHYVISQVATSKSILAAALGSLGHPSCSAWSLLQPVVPQKA